MCLFCPQWYKHQIKFSNNIIVSAKDHYVVIVSTVVETENPEQEILPGINLLGPILDRFVSISDILEPIGDGSDDNVFITKSYDATSHFESVCSDVKDVFKRATGAELKLEGKIKKLDENGMPIVEEHE